MREVFEEALKIRPGDVVTAAHSSIAPNILTEGRQYRVGCIRPVYSASLLVVCELGLRKEVTPESRRLLDVASERAGSEICNVEYLIRDDSGKNTWVSYIAFR